MSSQEPVRNYVFQPDPPNESGYFYSVAGPDVLYSYPRPRMTKEQAEKEVERLNKKFNR